MWSFCAPKEPRLGGEAQRSFHLYLHVIVVIFFSVPCVFVYMRPTATLSVDKAVAVFYTTIKPMLNPLIYTLRNDQMKNAIRKLYSKKAILNDKSMCLDLHIDSPQAEVKGTFWMNLTKNMSEIEGKKGDCYKS